VNLDLTSGHSLDKKSGTIKGKSSGEVSLEGWSQSSMAKAKRKSAESQSEGESREARFSLCHNDGKGARKHNSKKGNAMLCVKLTLLIPELAEGVKGEVKLQLYSTMVPWASRE